ncbi:MAG: hypothetical protein ABIK07_19905 [Planctomycetota bacterium]
MAISKNRRRKWKVDLKVDLPSWEASTPPNHPLHNVNEVERNDSRVQTLGEVLAKIAPRVKALRLANGKDDVK